MFCLLKFLCDYYYYSSVSINQSINQSNQSIADNETFLIITKFVKLHVLGLILLPALYIAAK